MPQHITLSELQSLIKRSIDDAHPLPYWVTAEISELKVNYSGHCYLELVEKGGANHVPKAKISAVIWRSTYGMIASYFGAATGGQTLCAGLKVLVKALVSYHELYGLSLQITDIDPSYTLGDMERQRRQTIEQLQRDGVFDMNRELPMPAVVQRLAVVSSRNAAGYQDFMKELSSGPYRFEVTLFDAFMQGAESEESIVRALETVADALDDFDAVVLIRGGGSQSDLGSFDSYRLCCHLAQFPLPVIAGIGHDKDRSVADLVAAVSLKTPTAVAVYLKNKMAEFEALLDSLRGRLAEWAEEMLGGCTTFLRERAMRLEQQTMRLVHECSLGLQRTGAELRTPCDRSGPPERRSARNAAFRSRSGCPFRFGESRAPGGQSRVDAAPSQLRFPIRASPRTCADGRSGRFARSPADTGDGLFGGSPERRGAGRSARAASGRPGRDRDAFPHVRSANR